ERREAYERLATLDAFEREDEDGALLWHKAILEENPEFLPSLRYIEQALIDRTSDPKSEELELVFTSIARTLAATCEPESAAHAELAARWRMHGDSGWDATGDLAFIVLAHKTPTLWALRMANAHARARSDHGALLATSAALAERTTHDNERAA